MFCHLSWNHKKIKLGLTYNFKPTRLRRLNLVLKSFVIRALKMYIQGEITELSRPGFSKT